MDNPVVQSVGAVLGSGVSTGQRWALAVNPTDIMQLSPSSEDRTIRVLYARIRLYADAAGGPYTINASTHALNGLGTFTTPAPARRVNGANAQTATLSLYTANPTVGGNVTVQETQDIWAGTNAAPAAAAVFDFRNSGAEPPTLRALWDGTAVSFALNLGGVALPANARVVLEKLEWTDEPVRKLVIDGDSRVSNNTEMQSYLKRVPAIWNQVDLRFYGNNGKYLRDLLPTAEANLSGLLYPMTTLASTFTDYGKSTLQPILVSHWLTNDVCGAGGCTVAEAVHRYNARLYIMKNGCVSGQSWTSTYVDRKGNDYGSRVFTWNATVPARPHVKTFIMIPGAYLADDPGATGFLAATGLYAGMSLEQAAQAATDTARAACLAFAGDERLNGGGIIDLQTFISPTTGQCFGRKVRNGVDNPLMTDRLHPSAWGGALMGEAVAMATGLL